MKNQLIVENLLGDTSLVLAVGAATFSISDNMLCIQVDFPAFYEEDTLEEDESGELIDPPEDYWFRESDALLEIEYPFSGVLQELLGQEIYLDSTDENNDDLTNFFIANTHYPTFDDKLLIKQTADSFVLIWSGVLPDINNSQYEIFMKNKFRFTLETLCEQE